MEDNNKTPNQDQTTGSGNEGENAGNNKSFTQEDMDKLASKVRAEEKAKADKATEEKVKAAMAEYERQAKLTQEEREKEARSKREKELADRESKITLRERKLEAAAQLSEKGVPMEFVDYVVDLDSEKMKDKIDNFAKVYSKAVESGITEKLKGTPPKDFGNQDQGEKKKKVTSVAF